MMVNVVASRFRAPCGLFGVMLAMARLESKFDAAGFDVVIIDDIGYVQQSRDEMEVLFTLLAERYERGSVMLTSNLPFSKWESIFKDPLTTAAAIDRLVHHSVILELNLPSYRLAVEFLAVGLVALTGHLGGFLSGVNLPG